MGLPNFGQMKELYSLQKKAKAAQKELKSLEIEARSSDGTVGVIVSGEMKIIDLQIATEALKPENKSLLERNIKETVTQAMSRAQSESASRLQPLMKDLNLPGM